MTRQLALCATLLAALAAPLSAQAAEPLVSVYSDIAPGACGRKPTRQLDEHEPERYRCRVLEKAFGVEKTYHGTYVHFTLTGRAGTARIWGGYDVGPKIEWRGRRTSGRFVPEAALVRSTIRLDDGERRGSVLAILRIDSGTPCLAAWTDAADSQANERARAAADALVGAFRCGGGAPNVIGPETEVLREVRERTRELARSVN